MRRLGALLATGVMVLGFSDSQPAGSVDKVDSVPPRDWIQRNGKSWQCASTVEEDVETTDTRENNRGTCPAGMVEVRGRMRVDPAPEFLDAMQKLTCLRWLSEEFPERCAEYDEARWSPIVAKSAQ